MAVEQRRGCGFRKVGGIYLVSEGGSLPCDRLPIKLDVCPVCSHGFKQSRGWTWVHLAGLVGFQISGKPWIFWEKNRDQVFAVAQGYEIPSRTCPCDPGCPLCKDPKKVGKAGLLWIGEKFYPGPTEFMREGREMGFSRRVAAIPRNFKVGETWVMLAHPKTMGCTCCKATGIIPVPNVPTATQECATCKGSGHLPGIFTLWKPSRIEKIFSESDRESEEVKKAVEQGITPVFFPDDDKDHEGTVYDKPEAEEQEAEAIAS